MGRRFDVVTFDCYGTLIDWESGIAAAFDAAAGASLSPASVLAAHAEIEPEVQGRRPHLRYRDVLAETALGMAARLGLRLDREQAGFLAGSLPGWRPFGDTNPALERLAAAGLRLGILSNVDDDLLRRTLEHFTVRFELLVTAEQVGAYKPSQAHFLEARRRLGHARWLHAAQSRFHDVAPARELGVPVAWINRHGERAPGGVRPDREFRDLRELADWLV
jgi:2-haloalkanoic acid dehalogenase type II